MFARCAVQVGHWKSYTPSDGRSWCHRRKWRDFYCSQPQLYDGKMSWNQLWDRNRSLTVHFPVILAFCFYRLALQLGFCLVPFPRVFRERLLSWRSSICCSVWHSMFPSVREIQGLNHLQMPKRLSLPFASSVESVLVGPAEVFIIKSILRFGRLPLQLWKELTFFFRNMHLCNFDTFSESCLETLL